MKFCSKEEYQERFLHLFLDLKILRLPKTMISTNFIKPKGGKYNRFRILPPDCMNAYPYIPECKRSTLIPRVVAKKGL